MANYLLVENRTVVHLGPIPWRQRFIQSEIDDLELDFTVPPVEQGYIRINDNFEIFPIAETVSPQIDPTFEQPVGPFYQYVSETVVLNPDRPEGMPEQTSVVLKAIANYNKVDRPLPDIKATIKTLAASQRYAKEIAGTSVTVGDATVTADTSRDGRNIFVQALSLMADNATVDWKFPEGWLTLTKAQLGTVVGAGAAHIQAQFDWEKSINDSVDAAQDVAALKVIWDALNPVQEQPLQPTP